MVGDINLKMFRADIGSRWEQKCSVTNTGRILEFIPRIQRVWKANSDLFNMSSRRCSLPTAEYHASNLTNTIDLIRNEEDDTRRSLMVDGFPNFPCPMEVSEAISNLAAVERELNIIECWSSSASDQIITTHKRR